MVKTKLVCTIGPKSESVEIIRKLYEKGMDMVRINMSHSSLEYMEKIVDNVRAVGNIPIILDLVGAEIRTGKLKDKEVLLEKGKKIKLFKKEIIGDENGISISIPDVLNQLKVWDIINLDDGAITLNVSDINKNFIECDIEEGGILRESKTVSINSLKYDLPTLTEKDKEAVKIGLKKNVEYVALSFVKKADDIDVLRNICDDMKLIAKIEHRSSLEDVDNIIDKADMILIDRGDLGAEIPVEKIPLVQKMIVKKCRDKNKEVFIATHLLESMVNKLRPSRAEVNDVINNVIDGVSGLVLAGETATGSHPVEALEMLVKLCKNAELVNHISDNEKIIERLRELNYI